MAAEYRLPAPKIPLNWVYFLLSTHNRQLPYTPVELTATCLQVLCKVINNFILLHSKEWVLGKFCLLLLTCLFTAIWDCILEITVIRERCNTPQPTQVYYIQLCCEMEASCAIIQLSQLSLKFTEQEQPGEVTKWSAILFHFLQWNRQSFELRHSTLYSWRLYLWLG